MAMRRATLRRAGAASSSTTTGGVPTTRAVIAGTGLTGGGDLSTDRTINVAANADGSIVVSANDVKVGVLATDAQHGNRGGGGIHAVATGAAAGFMSAADKAKLDTLGATNVTSPLSGDGSAGNPLAILPASTSAPGSMSAADKAKLDQLPSVQWAQGMFMVAQAAVPSLTAFVYEDFITADAIGLGAFAAASRDPSIDGGVIKLAVTGGISAALKSVVVNSKTSTWATGTRFKLFHIVDGAGETMWLCGLCNTGLTHWVQIAMRQTDSSTILQIEQQNASSTKTAGTGAGSTPGTTWHDALLTFDGTTLRAFIDGVQIASSTTLTNHPTDALVPSILGNLGGVAGDLRVDAMFFAFARAS